MSSEVKMKYYLLALFCLGALNLNAIVGTYTFTNTDPYDNETYTGTATITKATDVIYSCEWVNNKGEKTKGNGLINGNSISFAFLGKSLSENIEPVGVVKFKIKDNTLDGLWIYWGQTLVGTEKLEKVK